MQTFAEIWRTFIPHLAQSLLPPGKEKAHMGLRIRAAKILVKQIKALGISQAGLLFELDVTVILEIMA